VFNRNNELLKTHGGLFVLTALVLILPLFISSSFQLRVLVVVWVYALAAIGLNLLMGFAGQVSMGHGGFFALGAYACALGPTQLGLSPLLSLPAGVVLAALIAFLVGRPILRLKGHYLAVATLGFGMLVFMVLTNEVQVTGGPDGMPVKRLTILGWKLKGSTTWYWVTGGMLILGAWVAFNIVNSPTGLALRALRDSEVVSSVMGIDVARYKLLVFVLSAAYAAAAGGALALFDGYVTPGMSDFLVSVQLVTMVVLGGMGSIMGSVIGAALLVALPQFLTALHDYEHAMLGLIMMLTIIFLRQGIVPTLTKALSGKRS